MGGLLCSELANQLFVGQTADEQRVVLLRHDVAIQPLNDNAPFVGCVDDAVAGFVERDFLPDDGVALDVAR